MIRALPRVALQLWIVLFIVFFGAEVIHLEPGLRIVTQVVYGIPLALWALLRLRGPHDRLDWAVLGLLGVYAVVCLFSRDRTESLGTLALATAYATWFLLMRRVARTELRGPVLVAIATGMAITLAFNAYLLIQEKLTWFAAIGDAPFEGVMTFPWESVNALPALVLVTIPFLAWQGPTRLRLVFAAVVALSAVVVVPLSMGRAGWLGLAVSALVAVLLTPAVRKFVPRLAPGQRLAGGIAIAVAAAAALVVVGPRVVNATGESGRLLLWEQGVGMIVRSPIVGSGPGTFSWARLDVQPHAADLLAVRLLHSVPLQMLVDGGVVLAIGVLAVGATWASTVTRRAGSWSAEDRVAIASVFGFLAALSFDDFSYLPAIVGSALVAAAFLAPTAPSTAAPRAGVRSVTLVVLALATLIALPNVVAVDAARAAAQAGRTAMVGGAYEEAATDFEAATRAHQEDGGYWLGLGMAAAYAGDEDRARAAYERATTVSPGDPRGFAGLAALSGEDIGHLRQATERTYGDPQYAVRLGLALAAAGRMDDATHSWARAVALRPQLLRILRYHETGISQDAVASGAIAIISTEPRPAPIENLVNLWDIGLALDALPDGANAAWLAVDAARHGDSERAADLARAAVTEAPYEARGYQVLAAVAAFACDSEAERVALSQEKLARGAYARAAHEPQIRREFIYREASLGPSQPPGAVPDLRIERWPWSLIDRPTGCGQ
ncbi:MAG: O-antigen ligase family protein [Candidatus Limnocylindria bacterium]